MGGKGYDCTCEKVARPVDVCSGLQMRLRRDTGLRSL